MGGCHFTSFARKENWNKNIKYKHNIIYRRTVYSVYELNPLEANQLFYSFFCSYNFHLFLFVCVVDCLILVIASYQLTYREHFLLLLCNHFLRLCFVILFDGGKWKGIFCALRGNFYTMLNRYRNDDGAIGRPYDFITSIQPQFHFLYVNYYEPNDTHVRFTGTNIFWINSDNKNYRLIKWRKYSFSSVFNYSKFKCLSLYAVHTQDMTLKHISQVWNGARVSAFHI